MSFCLVKRVPGTLRPVPSGVRATKAPKAPQRLECVRVAAACGEDNKTPKQRAKATKDENVADRIPPAVPSGAAVNDPAGIKGQPVAPGAGAGGAAMADAEPDVAQQAPKVPPRMD